MSSDGAILNLGVITNISSIQQGMADSVAAVKAAAAAMTVDFKAVQGVSTAAFRQIRTDSIEAAKSLQNDAIVIAQSSKEIRESKQAEIVIYRQLRKGVIDEAEAIALLAVQQEAQRAATDRLTESKRRLASEQQVVAETAHAEVTQVQATSAAIRSFEGNPGMRAMENFVAKTLGLGPVMQAVFPIVGALAFLDIAKKIGEELLDCREKAINAGKSIAEAFDGLHDRALITNDDLRIQDDKLQDEIDKLGGHPGNGLQTALDEAIKRADQLLVSLKADEKAMSEIFKGNAVGFGGDILAGVAGTGKQQKEMLADGLKLQDEVRRINADYARELLDAKTADAQKAAGERQANAIRGAFQAQIDAYTKESARLKADQKASEADAAFAEKTGVEGSGRRTVDNSAKIANIEGATQVLRARLQQEELGQKLAADAENAGSLKGGKGSEGAENKAAEQQLRNIETQFAQMNTKLPEEALAFWSRFNGTFKEGSTEYLHVIEQVNKYTAEFEKSLKDSGKLSAEMKKNAAEASAAVPESVTRGIEEFNKHLVEQAEDITRTGARWDGYGRSVLKGQEILTAHNLAMQEMAIKAAEAAHALSPVAAAQQLAALHTAAHTAKLKDLEAELERLQAEGANLQPGDKGYEQNQTKQQDARNAISQEKGSGQQQKVQDATATANAMAKPYLTAFDAINNGWLKLQNDLIAGNGRIGQDARKIALQMTQDFAKHVEQSIANNLRMEIQKAAQHRATAAMNGTVDAAAEAQSVQASALAAIKKQAHAAANAAGKAYVAFADIPIVGPELGAVAAAATYAGVMALAAFEKGGIVAGSPGMAVPILAHSGERVLTTTQTNNFERMVNNSSNSGTLNLRMGDSHFNGAGGNAGDFHGQFQQHERKIIGSLKQWHREGKLAFATS